MRIESGDTGLTPGSIGSFLARPQRREGLKCTMAFGNVNHARFLAPGQRSVCKLGLYVIVMCEWLRSRKTPCLDKPSRGQGVCKLQLVAISPACVPIQ